MFIIFCFKKWDAAIKLIIWNADPGVIERLVDVYYTWIEYINAICSIGIVVQSSNKCRLVSQLCFFFLSSVVLRGWKFSFYRDGTLTPQKWQKNVNLVQKFESNNKGIIYMLWFSFSLGSVFLTSLFFFNPVVFSNQLIFYKPVLYSVFYQLSE